MSHNRALKALLNEITTIAKKARTEEDFKPIFEKLKKFENTVGAIKYDHTAKLWVLGIIGVCIGLLTLAYFFFPLSDEIVREYLLWGVGVCTLAMLVPTSIMLFAHQNIENISDEIFGKDIYFDNELVTIPIKGRKRVLYKKYLKQFGDFRDRGDEDRYIEELVRGKYTGAELALQYDYYVFHYVRVYYVPVTRTIGKTTVVVLERRTETLYRYGIIADFNYAEGIAVVSGGGSYDYPNRWETSSESFNHIFTVYAETEITAARFLKPAVVLTFNGLAEHFSGLNVEITRNGKLNISFDDDNVLSRERVHSITFPIQFEAEILSRLALPKLDTLLDFMETLKRFNDNNFEDTSPQTESAEAASATTQQKGETT